LSPAWPSPRLSAGSTDGGFCSFKLC
jgi:hypothetical protein